jgi:DNA-binding NarL/FixJ family response regulator
MALRLRGHVAVQQLGSDGVPKLRVLLVDDHAIVREGLRSILAHDPSLEVVAEASDGLDGCEQAARLRPDVVIMDISMPRLNGPDATRRVLRASPHSKVIALTVHDELPYVRELLRAGATGYVLKRTIVRDLLQAIHIVASGGLFLDSALARGGVSRRAIEEVGTAGDLSAREIDVASLSARGHTNAEIAAILSIGIKTVETHKTHMMAKLGLKTRAQLVRYAVHRGWLSE